MFLNVFVAESVAQSRIHIYVFAVLTATKTLQDIFISGDVRATNLATTQKLLRRSGEGGVGAGLLTQTLGARVGQNE